KGGIEDVAVAAKSLDGACQRLIADLVSANEEPGPHCEIDARKVGQLAHQADRLRKAFLQADESNCGGCCHASARTNQPNTNARWGHRRESGAGAGGSRKRTRRHL